MANSRYKIRKGSPNLLGTVDGITLAYGDHPVELTEDQAERLSAVDVTLVASNPNSKDKE